MNLEFDNALTKVDITIISFSIFYKIKVLVKIGMKLVRVKLGDKNRSLNLLFLIIKKLNQKFYFSCNST